MWLWFCIFLLVPLAIVISEPAGRGGGGGGEANRDKRKKKIALVGGFQCLESNQNRENQKDEGKEKKTLC